MKVAIINAYGRSNRGDAVLLDECIAEILATLPNSILSCSLFEYTDSLSEEPVDVSWSERIGNSRRKRLGKLQALLRLIVGYMSIHLKAPWISSFLPAAQRRTIGAIRGSEIVVSSPGGYIHDTNFAFYIALYHIYLAVAAKKVVILAPQSFGPIRGRFARWVARYVLTKVRFICSRENYSRNFLIELGVNSDSIFDCGDSAFWNDDVEREFGPVSQSLVEIGVTGQQRVFGVTCVGWTFPHNIDPIAAYKSYILKMASILDAIYLQYDLVPVIFNQVSDDIPTAFEIKRNASAPVIVDTASRDPRLLRGMIERSTVFLGTRFHSCIFALVGGRPTHAVAYLPKTSHIMEDLNLRSRSFSIEEIPTEVIISQISFDIDNLAEAEVEVRSAVSKYRSSYMRLRDVIKLAIET